MSKNNKKISFNAFEIIDEFLYFSALNRNGLYRMRIDDNQVEFIDTFPNEKIDIRHLHGAIRAYEGKLYFAPYLGNCLNIYDINEKKFTTIDLIPYISDVKGKFYGMLLYDRKIILIPSRAKSIVVYDIDSAKIECHSEWTKSVDMSINESIPQIKNGSFINEDKLYIPYGKYAAIIEINLNSFEARSIEFEKINCGFVDAIFSAKEKKVYLLANGRGSIYELSLETMEIVEYASNEDYNEIQFPYIKMIDMFDSILLVMYQAKYSLLFDKNTHIFKIIKFDVTDSVSFREWNAYFYSAQRISSNETIMMGTGDYLLTVIDNSCALKKSFTLEDDMAVTRLMKSQNKALLNENVEMDVEDFVNYIIHE